MKKTIAAFALPALAFVLSGCATGDSLSATSAAANEVSKGQSRIVIYRTSIMGAGIHPKVLVDGQETDTCEPNKVFFVEVPAGHHVISTKTESSAAATVNLVAGSTAYVECSLQMGIFVGRPKLKVVDNAAGSATVQELVFSGSHSVP